MTVLDSIKNAFHSVVEEVEKIPHAFSVVVAGAEHAIGTGYSSAKTVVSDAYTGAKTVAYDSIDLAGHAEKQALSPFTHVVDSFGTPLLFVGGALGIYIIYEMSQTSRAALPYAPQILESAGRIAPVFGMV